MHRVRDTQDLLLTFDEQMRRGTGGVATPWRTVRQVDDGADGWAGVVFSDLDERTADAAIAAEAAWADGPLGTAREFEWKLYAHDRPADLGARLSAAGFTAGAPETLMVAEVAALPQRPAVPAGVRLETVTDAAGVERAVAVHEQAFAASADRLRSRLLHQLAQAPHTLHLVVAMAGDVPVCAARMEVHPGTDFASLWGGGTVPHWRGRGVYRALVAHRAGLAAGLGVRYLQVDASDDSRPVLERLGFAALDVTTPYVRGREQDR